MIPHLKSRLLSEHGSQAVLGANVITKSTAVPENGIPIPQAQAQDAPHLKQLQQNSPPQSRQLDRWHLCR